VRWGNLMLTGPPEGQTAGELVEYLLSEPGIPSSSGIRMDCAEKRAELLGPGVVESKGDSSPAFIAASGRASLKRETLSLNIIGADPEASFAVLVARPQVRAVDRTLLSGWILDPTARVGGLVRTNERWILGARRINAQGSADVAWGAGKSLLGRVFDRGLGLRAGQVLEFEIHYRDPKCEEGRLAATTPYSVPILP
ncbi:MAG: hypothetical protein AAF368_19880, partial [Planctomycetota bacterium]